MKKVYFDHEYNRQDHWAGEAVQFYAALMKSNDYNARILECVEIYDLCYELDYELHKWFIKYMKHLRVTGAAVYLSFFIDARKYAPNLNMITFISGFNLDDAITYKPLQIQTLRLIDLYLDCSFEILLDDEELIYDSDELVRQFEKCYHQWQIQLE